MIVKNEVEALPRLAATLDGQIDHWTIVDTGSTDGTAALVEELFAGVPGEVICDTWRGYGPSRNVALARARLSAEWVLHLDADEAVHGALERAIPAAFDGVEAEQHSNDLRFWTPRLVRSSEKWEWRGRAHEYLTLPGGVGRLMPTRSFYVEHHADGGNRATKFPRELALLQADHAENPDDPRTNFYLARTYEDMGRFAPAAASYRRRIALPAWAEETWYAMWGLGRCLVKAGQIDEGCGVLWNAWGSRPWRAEPLWTLAEHYRQTSQWRLCFEVCELARRHCAIGAAHPGDGFGGDRLFVHTDVYEWRIAYEQSICAYYVGERDLGRLLTEQLLARADLPPVLVANVTDNRRFYDLTP
jgi:glycosyltransferase involved in cell wall biosynthesis